MLEQANRMLARELDADRRCAAHDARNARAATVGLDDTAARLRQRARVRASLLLLPRDDDAASPGRSA